MSGDHNYPAEVPGYRFIHLGIVEIGAMLRRQRQKEARMESALDRYRKIRSDIDFHEEELTELKKLERVLKKEIDLVFEIKGI